MFIKDTEDFIPETFQIRSTKIKFADIHSKFFIVKIFCSSDSSLLSVTVSGSPFKTQLRSESESRKVQFRKHGRVKNNLVDWLKQDQFIWVYQDFLNMLVF